MTVVQQQWNAKMGQHLLARAMKDEMFRQELLTNPKTLIEHELGVTLPQGLTIQVHEDAPTTVHLVLPRRQLQTVEVSDADLVDDDPSILTYSYDCGPTLGCC